MSQTLQRFIKYSLWCACLFVCVCVCEWGIIYACMCVLVCVYVYWRVCVRVCVCVCARALAARVCMTKLEKKIRFLECVNELKRSSSIAQTCFLRRISMFIYVCFSFFYRIFQNKHGFLSSNPRTASPLQAEPQISPSMGLQNFASVFHTQRTILNTSPSTVRHSGNEQNATPTNPSAAEESRLSVAQVFFLVLDDMLPVGTVNSFLITAAASIFVRSQLAVLTLLVVVGLISKQLQLLCSRDGFGAAVRTFGGDTGIDVESV